MARIDLKRMILYPYRIAANAFNTILFGAENETPLLIMRGKHCTDGGSPSDSEDGEVTLFHPYRDPEEPPSDTIAFRGQMNQKDCPEDSTSREDWGKSIGHPYRDPDTGLMYARAPTWCEPCPKNEDSDPVPFCYGGWSGTQESCSLSDKAYSPGGIVVPEYLDVTLAGFSDCCNDNDPGTSDDGHAGTYHGTIRGTTIVCSPCGATDCTTSPCTTAASVPCFPDVSHGDCSTNPDYEDYALVAQYIGCASDVAFPESCDSDGDPACHRYSAGGCPDCEAGDTDCICASEECDPSSWNSGTGECDPTPHVAPVVDVEICIKLYCYSGTLKVRSVLLMVIDLHFTVSPFYTHYESCVKQDYIGCFEITQIEDTCLDINDSYMLTTSRTCGEVAIGEDQTAGTTQEWTATLAIAARQAA